VAKDPDLDTAHLARLLEPHHFEVQRIARSLCRSPHDGDDLYQEAVLKACRKVHTLRDDKRFRSWFVSLLFNIHRSRCRRSFWKRFVTLDEAALREAETGSTTPVHGDPAGARRVASALSRLPAVQREAVVLFEIEGYSVDEIASIQEVSVPAVKSRLSRGRERLRRHYEKSGWVEAGEHRRAGRSSQTTADRRADRASPMPGHEISGTVSAYASATGLSREGGRHE
jgi:RNA polymerase sigma-70 factor (ECF subfamily)